MKKILFVLMVFLGVRVNAQEDPPLVALETTIELDYFGSEFSAWLYWINEDNSLTLVQEWWGYPNGQQGATFIDTLYLPQGCYYLVVNDDYGDGFGFTHGSTNWKQLRSLPLSDTTLVSLVNNYEDFEGVICLFLPEEVITEVYGCMDALACNYDPLATVPYGCLHVGDTCDDGIELSMNDTISENCGCHGTIVISGCMDSLAMNYNFEATINDGSCIYPIVGCMDYTACNYDPTATLNNGCDFVSCIIIGCTDPWAFNFNPDATQPNFLDPYFGCEYWIPTEISVVQTCNDFTFTASASDGSPMPFVFANIYNWTIGNDISVEMVGPSISYSLTEDGMYIVVFIYSQGAFITSVQVDVTVAIIDSVTLTVSNDTLFCETQNADWYLWSLDGDVFNQSSNPWMIPTETGVYTCTAVSNEGCMVASNDVAIDLEPIEITCCTGDFNCDGFISVADLVVFIADYGCSGQECIADFDHNNIVGVSDLMQFISLYGTTCPN